MKSMAIHVFSFIYCLVIVLAGIATGTKPTPPYLSGLWPGTMVDRPGKVTLHYFAKFNDGFGPVTFSVNIDGALGYDGEMSWTAETHDGDSLSREIIVNVPPLDTCGIEIRIDKEGICLTSAYCYFVTGVDSVEVHRGDPRMNPFSGKFAYAYSENQDTGKKLPYGPGHSAPPPKMTVHTPSDEERMLQMERQPLTDADVQHFEVDGEIWTRSRGEYKFKKLEQLSHEQYYQELMDKYGDSTSFRVIIDLRDSANYRFVSQVTDSALQKTDSVGFFETILTKKQLWEIFKRGIAFQNCSR